MIKDERGNREKTKKEKEERREGGKKRGKTEKGKRDGRDGSKQRREKIDIQIQTNREGDRKEGDAVTK